MGEDPHNQSLAAKQQLYEEVQQVFEQIAEELAKSPFTTLYQVRSH